MNVNIFVIITAVASICSITFGVLGYILASEKNKKEGEKELKTEGKDNGVLMSDIGYIKSGIDDLKRKQETSEVKHYALVERVTKCEESTKSAHHRLDAMEGKKG